MISWISWANLSSTTLLSIVFVTRLYKQLMVVYQKSFFDQVPQKFGLVHLKNELKGQSVTTGHLELPGLTSPVPQDNYVAVQFLENCEFDVDDGRWF